MPYHLISHHICTIDGMEMFRKGEEAHVQAMERMPEEMAKWMTEFEALPEIG